MLDRQHDVEAEIARLTSFVTVRLARTQHKLMTHNNHFLISRGNLTIVEWRILRILATLAASTMADLARQAEIDKAQISRKLKNLQSKGLVHIHPDPNDHRQQVVTLSRQGHESVSKLIPLIIERQRQLTSDISTDEMKTFLNVLEKLDAAASRTDDDQNLNADNPLSK